MIPIATTCIGTPDTGWGCREDLRGWRVLDLHGTEHRIGELYATLLRDEILEDLIPMSEDQHYGEMPTAFRWLFEQDQRHYPAFFDPRTAARAAGFEEALGLTPGTVQRYAWLGDLGSIGPALQLALGGTVQLDATTGRVSDRCTSIVGRDGEATVHARNLDYWGMGFWQSHATITFVEPLDADGEPDGWAYAHVGTVGELFAGTTGVNEAGVALSTHLHATRDVAMVFGRMRLSLSTFAWEAITGRHPQDGQSVYVLVETVLREADDIDEAVALLEQSVPLGAWSFVVSDPSGRSAVVAANHRERQTTWDARVNTNFYLDDAMEARELHPARGPLEGARLRYERAEELLGDGPLDPSRAVAILRDRFDGAVGHDRVVSANSPLSPDTSQTVVMVTAPAESPVLWIAEPQPDGYLPAALAPQFALSLADGLGGPGRSVRGEIPGDPSDKALLAAYLEAMRLALDVRDRPGAAAALRALPTDDAGIRLMAALATAAVGELDLARTELDRFRADGASHHHRVLAAWLDGELAWRAQRPDDARRAWERGLDEIADADGPWAHLDGPMGAVLGNRLDRLQHRPRLDLPFPDLKFQDVLELRLE